MTNRTTWTVLPLLLAAHATAQTVLYGVRGNGDLLRVNPATGAAVLIGSSAFSCRAAAGYALYDSSRWGTHIEYLLTGGGDGAQADQIISLYRWSGTGGVFLNTTGRPPGYGIRGMVIMPSPTFELFVLLSADNPTTTSLLARIDWNTGAYTVIGPTGRTDLQGLAMSPSGTFYTLGTDGGGNLYTLSPASGAATLIGGGGFGSDDHALEFLPDGTLVACGANLRSVDPSTGATTLIGPTGFTDIGALAAITACYIDCSSGGPPPCLNVLDFGCFLNRFAAGDLYANCDLSTTPPVLNVLDFMCFLNRWAAGCSAC